MGVPGQRSANWFLMNRCRREPLVSLLSTSDMNKFIKNTLFLWLYDRGATWCYRRHYSKNKFIMWNERKPTPYRLKSNGDHERVHISITVCTQGSQLAPVKWKEWGGNTVVTCLRCRWWQLVAPSSSWKRKELKSHTILNRTFPLYHLSPSVLCNFLKVFSINHKRVTKI